MDKVTILILSFNRSWSLMQCVASIREWTQVPYHIVIQDHCSDLEHWHMIEQLAGSDCTVLRSNSPLSCNEGRRLGLDHVTGQYCVFLDDDIKVERNWLARMLIPMHKYDGIGAVCGQVVQNYGNERMCWGRGLDGSHVRRMEFGYTGFSDFCGGGATLYNVDALRQTEYREEYNGTGEDWDQILQMRQNGWRVFCSDAQFFHFHQSDFDLYSRDRWRHSEIMDSALSLFERWGIVTVAFERRAFMAEKGITLTDEQRKRFEKI